MCGISAFKVVLLDHLLGWALWSHMLLPIFAFIASIMAVTARDWLLRESRLTATDANQLAKIIFPHANHMATMPRVRENA